MLYMFKQNLYLWCARYGQALLNDEATMCVAVFGVPFMMLGTCNGQIKAAHHQEAPGRTSGNIADNRGIKWQPCLFKQDTHIHLPGVHQHSWSTQNINGAKCSCNFTTSFAVNLKHIVPCRNWVSSVICPKYCCEWMSVQKYYNQAW